MLFYVLSGMIRQNLKIEDFMDTAMDDAARLPDLSVYLMTLYTRGLRLFEMLGRAFSLFSGNKGMNLQTTRRHL